MRGGKTVDTSGEQKHQSKEPTRLDEQEAKPRHRQGLLRRIVPGVLLCLVLLVLILVVLIPRLSPDKIRTVDLGDGVKMVLVWIPPGEFMMGGPSDGSDGDEGALPKHGVRIMQGFWMGKCEVTQEQWQAVTGDNPAHYGGAENPVEDVTWEDCQGFLKKLNLKTGVSFRLPSEAEWEYACRAGASTDFYFGDDPSGLGDYDWYAENSDSRPQPVGLKKPNAWGLHDMHGNVSEWCEDDWHDGYAGAPADGTAWLDSPREPYRVTRGGSSECHAGLCRAQNRYRHLASSRFCTLGLRVVLPADQAGSQLELDRVVRARAREAAEEAARARARRKAREAEAERLALTAEEAARLQAETAPKGQIKRAVDLGNGVTLELTWIPPGAFMMGTEEGRSYEGPLHRVRITRGFWLGTCEVTQEQWQEVMGNNPSGFSGDRRLPVEMVSWYDCQDFVQELSRDTGERFRLPTEAEWEYACRAGTITKFHFGDDPSQLEDYGWYGGNGKGLISPIGQKRPNAWGLHDMLGNVSEWVEDWFGSDFYSTSPECDPRNTSPDEFGICRGGETLMTAEGCDCASRGKYVHLAADNYTGFRVVCAELD